MKKKTRNSKIHLIFYHMNLDEVLPCDVLFKKIIEILLNHIFPILMVEKYQYMILI